MALRGIATDIKPLSACIDLDDWHRGHACPASGSGQRLVHYWVPKALEACKHFGMSVADACEWTEQNMTRVPQSNREVSDWAEIVYGEQSGSRSGKSEKQAQYNPAKLKRRANRISVDITREWLAERSPLPVSFAPEQFLRAIYREHESIWIGTRKNERRGRIWTNDADMSSLDCLRNGHEGVWFLANPVTGKPAYNGEKNQWFPNGETWRTEESVTSWRYMVIESDEAPENLWLRMLVQIQLPISAIYTSGGESIHALVRVDQPSKAAWDQYKDSIKRELIELGACPGSLSAVRLTRLPGCTRGETGQLQRLLYLNPQPTNTPIFKLEPRSK
jgi:hypothetical protein